MECQASVHVFCEKGIQQRSSIKLCVLNISQGVFVLAVCAHNESVSVPLQSVKKQLLLLYSEV